MADSQSLGLVLCHIYSPHPIGLVVTDKNIPIFVETHTPRVAELGHICRAIHVAVTAITRDRDGLSRGQVYRTNAVVVLVAHVDRGRPRGVAGRGGAEGNERGAVDEVELADLSEGASACV